MANKFHTFHIITLSPWPIITSGAIWLTTSLMVNRFSSKRISLSIPRIAFLIIVAFLWWKDVVRESLKQGFHFNKIVDGLKIGMLLFISSEVLFFASFFWAYFHSRVSPCVEIGQRWPPNRIEAFNPINVPLLNTIILLSSGISITWRHHLFLGNYNKEANITLLLTCLLGVYFTLLQGLEYWQASFSINDSSYGATFFMATGFHGMHVLVGTSFLFICWYRRRNKHNNISHLIGFEIAAWYWHFVDVVWLFLYISIYWWGN